MVSLVWPGRGPGPACQRLASAAPRRSRQLQLSSSWSPLASSRLVLASSARGPSSGSAHDGKVFQVAPTTALLGPLAELPRLSPATGCQCLQVSDVSRASRQYPCSWRLMAASRASRYLLAAAYRPYVAPAVSTPNYAARLMSASQVVSTRCGSQVSRQRRVPASSSGLAPALLHIAR